ncbi:MAG: hypothetical protein KDE22_18020 [Rhodobacterales bacterium]|nr:hypothetical protein [Rhodobacterales bacterium]
MFNPTQLVIDHYVERLKDNYTTIYGMLEPDYKGIIGFTGRMALENISNSDAPYHDVHHTILVTDVGQEILKGKHLSEGGVSPSDWLHFVVSLLCHDIGYVRGICAGDDARDRPDGAYVTDFDGNRAPVPRGSTDAAMTPYHINRSKLFARQRFSKVPAVDCAVIEANIEYTRFPVPEGDTYNDHGAYPGLLRAADLIGQMADLGYLRKTAALYTEFRETGAAQALGYESPADLRDAYPRFFWTVVRPLIGPALRYLKVTQQGQQWVNNLYANVFVEEHGHDAGD